MRRARVALWLGATLTPAAALEVAAAEPSARAPARSDAERQALVDGALLAFEQGDLERALRRFDQALADPATPSNERALLAINAGVCLMGLSRPSEAEARFEGAARLDPKLRRVARLQAGHAAAAAGAVERAREVLRAVQPQGPEELRLSRQLRQAVEFADQGARARGHQEALARAYEQLDAEPDEARGSCERALGHADNARQRAEAHYCSSLSLRALGEKKEALAASERAIAAAPKRHAFHYLRGLLLAEAGQLARAERSLARALSLNPPAEDRARIERARSALHPLGRSGWAGLAEVGLGVDTNAAQSGSAERRGLASTGLSDETVNPTASAAVSAQVLAEGRWRPSARWVWLSDLAAEMATLTDPQVSALGLFTAAAHVGAGLLVTPDLQLEVRGGGEHLRQGPNAAEALLTEWGAELTARLQREQAAVLLGLLHRFVQGHGQEASPLSGSRSRAWAGAHWEPGRWAFAGSAGWTKSRAGSLQLNTDLARVPACSGALLAMLCQSASFDVPLSYNALDWGVQASGSLSRRWSALGSAGLSRRWYQDPSRLTVGPARNSVEQSEVLRRDWTYELALELRFALPWSESQSLWLSHQSRFNRSNLRPDLGDPVRRFHYEDRNFDQHRSAIGYRLDW